jgi:hypothetical protein
MNTATKESVMNEQKPGAALVAALREECERQGKAIGHLAALLGLAATYWASICSGSRTIQPLVEKKETCSVFSEFLRLPRISVMSLAEVVLPGDFIVEQGLDDQMNGVYMQMAADPMWSTLVPRPQAWDEADREMKLLVVTMYQVALQESMLEKASQAKQKQRLGHFAPREGLAPALDQLGKWGQAPRQAA